jgi:hypothetical protein
MENLCGPVDDKRMVLFELQELRMLWRLWPSRTRKRRSCTIAEACEVIIPTLNHD